MKDALTELKTKFGDKFSVDTEDLEYNSTDGSIFKVMPQAIFTPADENDVIELIKFIATKAEQGVVIPIAARGAGTDQGGGPLTEGIVVSFTKFMNKTLEIAADYVRVQPGKIYGQLEKELKEVGTYIPTYPASIEISTVGGAVANNAAGEKTLKYGSTRKFVESLRVVLSDGEVIVTDKLTKKQLEAKQSLKTKEGEIYRRLDALITEHEHALSFSKLNVTKNSAGYDLWDVRDKFNFDLGQLITGSQGTLGIVTEITFRTVPLYKACVLLVGYFDDLYKAGTAVQELLLLKPVSIEMVDHHLIKMVEKHDPKLLEGLLPKGPIPKLVLLVEFDGDDRNICGQDASRAEDVLKVYTTGWETIHDEAEQEQAWKLRRSAAAVIWTVEGPKKALPIIEDGTVPPSQFPVFVHKAYDIFKKYDLDIAVWGHAGDADLHMQPFLDLADVKDRDKIFKIMEDFYTMIHKLGGTTSGEHNDGILRTPYLFYIYPQEMIELFAKIKDLFDPKRILNPGKKIGGSLAYAKAHLRTEYDLHSIISDRQQLNR